MATPKENIDRVKSVLDRMVMNIESKGISVPMDITAEEQVDKILDISEQGEIEKVLTDNGWEAAIVGILNQIQRTIEVNNNPDAVVANYTDVNSVYTRPCIIDPMNPLEFGNSSVNFRDDLYIIKKNALFNETTNGRQKFNANRNMILFEPTEFPLLTDARDMFNRSGCEELNLNLPVCTQFGGFAYGCQKLKKVTINIDSSIESSWGNAFELTPLLDEVHFTNGVMLLLGLQSSMFNNSSVKIVTGAIYVNLVTSYQRTIDNCPNLETIYINGYCGGGLSFAQCPNISIESLQYFVDNAAIPTAANKTIYFGAINYAKLTDEMKATLTGLGYTLNG